jgi:hypothetical protein
MTTKPQSPEQLIPCPFCEDTDFDSVGLKIHLTSGHCEKYNNLSVVLPITIKAQPPSVQPDDKSVEEATKMLANEFWNLGLTFKWEDFQRHDKCDFRIEIEHIAKKALLQHYANLRIHNERLVKAISITLDSLKICQKSGDVDYSLQIKCLEQVISNTP